VVGLGVGLGFGLGLVGHPGALAAPGARRSPVITLGCQVDEHDLVRVRVRVRIRVRVRARARARKRVVVTIRDE